MTAHPTPSAGNMLKWIEALEAPDAPKQMFGHYFDTMVEDDGKTSESCCAVGLGCKALALPVKDFEDMLGESGLSSDVIRWNDKDRLTFPQIAAKIREWCKENGIELSTEATG